MASRPIIILFLCAFAAMAGLVFLSERSKRHAAEEARFREWERNAMAQTYVAPDVLQAAIAAARSTISNRLVRSGGMLVIRAEPEIRSIVGTQSDRFVPLPTWYRMECRYGMVTAVFPVPYEGEIPVSLHGLTGLYAEGGRQLRLPHLSSPATQSLVDAVCRDAQLVIQTLIR